MNEIGRTRKCLVLLGTEDVECWFYCFFMGKDEPASEGDFFSLAPKALIEEESGQMSIVEAWRIRFCK